MGSRFLSIVVQVKPVRGRVLPARGRGNPNPKPLPPWRGGGSRPWRVSPRAGFPLEAREVRILNVRLLDLYKSPGTLGRAAANIRYCVTKRQKGGGRVGML